MGWDFNDLPYGWKIAAGVVLAGTTIYVAGNQRMRVNQADFIELFLGVHERCLAASISAPEFEQYMVFDGEARYVTNTFGFRTPIGGGSVSPFQLETLDSKIKQLVPYFVDTNTLYAGSDTIANLTVTGLWARLEIGDGVSEFTQWRRGRITIDGMYERYKVLESLKYLNTYSARALSFSWDNTNRYIGISDFEESWNDAKAGVEGDWKSQHFTAFPSKYTSGLATTDEVYFAARGFSKSGRLVFPVASTGVSQRIDVYAKAKAADRGVMGNTITNAANKTFDGYDVVDSTNGWRLIDDSSAWSGTNQYIYSAVFGDTNFPTWCEDPTTGTPFEKYEGYEYYMIARGYEVTALSVISEWQFLYATNRFW